MTNLAHLLSTENAFNLHFVCSGNNKGSFFLFVCGWALFFFFFCVVFFFFFFFLFLFLIKRRKEKKKKKKEKKIESRTSTPLHRHRIIITKKKKKKEKRKKEHYGQEQKTVTHRLQRCHAHPQDQYICQTPRDLVHCYFFF